MLRLRVKIFCLDCEQDVALALAAGAEYVDFELNFINDDTEFLPFKFCDFF